MAGGRPYQVSGVRLVLMVAAVVVGVVVGVGVGGSQVAPLHPPQPAGQGPTLPPRTAIA